MRFLRAEILSIRLILHQSSVHSRSKWKRRVYRPYKHRPRVSHGAKPMCRDKNFSRMHGQAKFSMVNYATIVSRIRESRAPHHGFRGRVPPGNPWPETGNARTKRTSVARGLIRFQFPTCCVNSPMRAGRGLLKLPSRWPSLTTRIDD